jgi:biopolymer transport protein TolR
MSKPEINVTPLIDVLLVLLIIFMVITPLKPSSFEARIPQERKKNDIAGPHPWTLIVNVGEDSSLALNKERGIGTVEDTGEMIARLRSVFQQRLENGARDDAALTPDRVPRAVFIKAPRKTGYGDVAKVIDAVKISGAYPISLQIDDLD